MAELAFRSLEEYELGQIFRYEHWENVGLSERDILRQRAARFALGRRLSEEELQAMADVLENGMNEPFRKRYGELLQYEIAGSPSFIFESLGSKLVSWARLSYPRAGLVDSRPGAILEFVRPAS